MRVNYRHRVQVWHSTTTEDSTGQPIETPVQLGTFPALVRYMKGNEKVVAQQTIAEASHKVFMRREVEIFHEYWLIWLDEVDESGDYRRLEVQDPALDDRGTKYTILCVERRIPEVD